MKIETIKGVTPADVKFFETYIAPKVRADNDSIANPFTGASQKVDPVIATLTDFVYELSQYEMAPFILKRWGVPAGRAVQSFDRARYLILKIDENVYRNFID